MSAIQNEPSTDTDRESVNSKPPEKSIDENSYGQILKSTSIIGGAQFINLMIGLIRTKFVAVLIGPAGVGMVSTYQSIIDIVAPIAGLGIQTSGVREIAKCHGQNDQAGMAKAVTNLRRICWFTGLAGMLIFAILAPWFSYLSFGSNSHTLAIACLGLTILFGNVSAGQAALIRGTRRIGDLARISIWGAVLGTVVSIGTYSWLGLNGAALALVLIAMCGLIVSTIYSRRLKIPVVNVTWQETINQSRELMQFGIAMVVNGLMVAGVAYFTRWLIIQDFGLKGVGIYSAAFALSGFFVQFILNAMKADFYPRLTAIAHDHKAMTKLMNEQTEIGLLMAFPGLLATMSFAPLVIEIFYTSEFSPASDLLVWLVLGCMGRVISWPLGFSILAKGQSNLFILTETTFNLLHLALVWAGIECFGLVGVSVAFAILYGSYTSGMLALNFKTIGFTWSRNVRLATSSMLVIALALILTRITANSTVATIVSILVLTTSSICCLKRLANVGKIQVTALKPRHSRSIS